MEYLLDFEKPLAAMRQHIEEVAAAAEKHGLDPQESTAALRRQLQELAERTYANLSTWDRVQLSRHPMRPYTLDYIRRFLPDFLELSGDRRSSDDKAIIGGPATFHGRKVMVIGTQKGRDTKENLLRGFGWPQPEGYRKALRLMRLANQAEIPILTFIDTPGAFPGIGSEERHISEAIAVNLREMFNFTVPIIATIIGEGGSGGAIGLGVGNRVLIQENAYYSVITPEGCAAILWKDRKYADKAAEALQLTAGKLLELGIVDEVIPEPPGGAHRDYDAAAAALDEALLRHLTELEKMDGESLVNLRYEKFRRMGCFESVPVPETPEAAEEAADK